YDGLPEGSVGAQGLVTRQSALAFSDALLTEVYGADPPDLAALGYFRRPAEAGWWLTQAGYQRIVDADGLRGTVSGPLAAQTRFRFNAAMTHPLEVTDPAGNTLRTEHDPRTNRMTRLIEPSGAVHAALYDALARPIASVAPGDSLELPTVSYSYDATSRPAARTRRVRAVSGEAAVLEGRELFDGEGALLQTRATAAPGEIASQSFRYGAR